MLQLMISPEPVPHVDTINPYKALNCMPRVLGLHMQAHQGSAAHLMLHADPQGHELHAEGVVGAGTEIGCSMGPGSAQEEPKEANIV